MASVCMFVSLPAPDRSCYLDFRETEVGDSCRSRSCRCTRGLLWSCVRQYGRSPEPTEDIAQMAYVGQGDHGDELWRRPDTNGDRPAAPDPADAGSRLRAYALGPSAFAVARPAGHSCPTQVTGIRGNIRNESWRTRCL